jgi:glutamate synthase (NADPH/NADH) large chain
VLNYREDEEHDACAIVAYVRKDGTPSHGTVKRAINALEKMGHRSGGVDGEGDGCGVQTDIPRILWARNIHDELGSDPSIADDPRFFVGHFFIPRRLAAESASVKQRIRQLLLNAGLEILIEDSGDVRHDALGKIARSNEPEFWQVSGLVRPFDHTKDPLGGERQLFATQLTIERSTPVHVCSLSTFSVVYKVHGNADILDHYYPQLSSPDYVTAISLGHSRYSTNTLSNFDRVQPFALLGHNGEINTIDKLRREAQMLGIPITPDGSDSQDLDRAMHGLIINHGLSLVEAMEIIFPPMADEVDHMPDDLRRLYRFYRWVLGPLAQGPAAIIARIGDESVFGVDALGLRPLWFVESGTEYVFSSEQGVLPFSVIMENPKPLAPGEKIAIQLHRGVGTRVYAYDEVQRLALTRTSKLYDISRIEKVLPLGRDHVAASSQTDRFNMPLATGIPHESNRFAAFNWSTSDTDYVESLCKTGNEPISSLGYDGPLAALAPEKQSLSDYYKEAVAVVTNPAMDREREVEHFSTMVTIGTRPHLAKRESLPDRALELKLPILPGVFDFWPHLTSSDVDRVAQQIGTTSLEGLLAYFGMSELSILSFVYPDRKTTEAALDQLKIEAIRAVNNGASILVLDDTDAFKAGTLTLDPHLALIAVDRSLREEFETHEGVKAALRRRSSLILRSGGLRNLHDIIFAIGSGADAVAPYLMLGQAHRNAPIGAGSDEISIRLYNVLSALQKGLEKVISTMGTHEMRGYGRIFASIGIGSDVSRLLELRNFCGSQLSGLTFGKLDELAVKKQQTATSSEPVKRREDPRFYPKVWKFAGNAASGKGTYEEYTDRLYNLEKELPISLRHLLDLRYEKRTPIDKSLVNAKVGGHDYPIELSSMSFGSQGETAFRAYAEAARRLNIVCLNGEGGEIHDMYGKFRNNRGQQVASGRFGVNIEMLNASDYIEIKIGQGAKPGEGGHLPGKKVSVKVAAARHATPGVDLISPSNNHDIYSIEDLAQIIEELHTANPNARVSVKVPVVPNIGTIALGIAKAGADIITLSGYDGGTGAARSHALKYVGLPVEIGVKEAHRALVQAGVRDEVELWCDGGMKSGLDVVKMLLLGANRCGFGTLTMVAVGCTVCHGCQLDTCHVGIATQIETVLQAEEHGLKRFVPREADAAVEGLVRLFSAIGEEVRDLTARLGFLNTQEMVGHSDLLVQARGKDLVDCFELTAPVLPMFAYETAGLKESRREAAGLSTGTPNVDPRVRKRIRRPLSYTTKMISTLVKEQTNDGYDKILYEDDRADPTDRELGTHLSGILARGEIGTQPLKSADLLFQNVIPGNGLGAFNSPHVNVRVYGGAQDGVAKGCMGGRVVIMKGLNDGGYRVNGSVGKGFAYGAIGGTFVIQGDADSRCGIRLSGANIVVGGEITKPIDDTLGCLGARANIKGFAFEYMTSGRALVLGDPGPWMCAGMTGGVVYLKLDPEMKFDRQAVLRRLGRGAKVAVADITDRDKQSISELLGIFIEELNLSDQLADANRVQRIVQDLWTGETEFVKVVPVGMQVDQSVATE